MSSNAKHTGLAVLIAAAILIGFIVGWSALVIWVYNSVALALGWKTVSFWVGFGLLFLLGVIGQAFRSARKHDES